MELTQKWLHRQMAVTLCVTSPIMWLCPAVPACIQSDAVTVIRVPVQITAGARSSGFQVRTALGER